MSNTNSIKSGVDYIINNTKYPDYIRNHAVFSKATKIKKVFPSIGLPNITEECDYVSVVEAKTDAFNLLYYGIRDSIYAAYTSGKLPPELKSIAYHVSCDIANFHPNMIHEENGKVSIKFHKDSPPFEGKPFAKTGESIFKFYNKFTEECKKHNYTVRSLEGNDYFKKFSSTNVSNAKKLKIIFSSSGEKGAWDLATISMRGISSCQTWGSTQSRGLIGSIFSKYVGVVYITSDEPFNDYGSKMLRRALVRFVVHKTNKTPALIVDKIYPGDDQTARSIIRSFLAKHVKMPVIYAGEEGWINYCLPIDPLPSNVVFQTNEFTYMDNKIAFKNLNPPKDITPFYNRINQLDGELTRKVHNSLKIKFDEYIINNKTHRSLFKGGVGNLILSIRKRNDPQANYLANYLPRLYDLNGLDPQKFENPKEYEKAIIKKTLLNISTVTSRLKYSHSKMGKYVKFYPTSLNKFTNLVIQEYKKELLNSYKNLITT